MSKPFTYWVRLATVATLCTLTTFNPVLAGRCIERLLKRNNCLPAACIEVPACESHCVVVPCGEPIATCDGLPTVPTTPAEPTAKESSTTEPTAPSVSPPQVEPVPTPAPSTTPPAAATESLTPITPPPATTPTTPSFELPAAPIEPAPATVELTPPASIPATPIEPAPAAKDPVDDLFGDDAATPAVMPPAESTPALPTPVTPETETPPKTETIDDLFGDSAKPAESAAEPIAEPAKNSEPAKEAAVDDMFGSETTPPAKEAPAEAPKDAIDDLFGLEKTETPANPTPEKKSDLDDLFGTESAEPAPAKTEPAPAQTESIDDLFGTPETKPAEGTTEPAKPADSLDDLFGKPVSTDTVEPAKTDDKYLDSLFPDKPEGKQPVPGTPATQPEMDSSPKKGNADPLDELFGLGEFTPPQQFRGAEFQTWVDNTGTYSVKARLAVIHTDRVKLLKENGKFTTVPLSRLSDRDFAYVQWVASNLSAEANAKFVKKDAENSDTESIR